MSQISMIIIDSDENSKNRILELLKQVNYIEIIGDFDNLLVGCDVVLQAKPNIALIDLTENTELGLEIIEKISSVHKNTIIFASAEKISTDIVINAMRAGAREFLTKPIIIEDLSMALRKARSIITSSEEDTTGQIISVFSNKGGIGKTSLAVNLAMNLNELTGKRVCIVDLNLQMGDITTFLDLNPSFDIAYVVTHLSRLDESFLISSMEKYKDRDLYILADPPNIEQAEEISANDITSVLLFLKSMFSYVIVDTSSNFDIKTLTCLDISDYIFLVLMVNLPSIRSCQKCMNLFKRLEYDEEKIKLIVNRYIPDDEITIEDVEEALDHKVFWKIPNNYMTVMSSINKGLPISELEPDSKINKNFMKLAQKLIGSQSVNEEDDEESESLINLPANFDFSAIINKLKSLNLPFLKKEESDISSEQKSIQQNIK